MKGYVPSKHLSFHELREQLACPGCAVCLLGAKAAARYLDNLSREQVLDPEVRNRLRASLGFCGQHAHQLYAMADRLSVAILYEDFLQRAERELEGWSRPRRQKDPLDPCSVCEAVQETEEDKVRLLATFIDDPEMAAAYEASPGLCLTHTLKLCQLLEGAARQRVVALERARIQRLRGELAEVRRKHDYRFRGEPWGEEKTSPSRAVAKISGERAAVDPGHKPE